MSLEDQGKSEIARLISAATPENPANVERICEIAQKSLDNYTKQDRVCAWLCMMGFMKNGVGAFREKTKELMSQYHDYCVFNEICDWDMKRFPSHFPTEEYDLHDNSLMATIHGDVVRTGRLIFFLDPLPLEKVINHVVIMGVEEGHFRDDQDEMLSNWEQHIRRIERILYVFARLNKGIGYMQGFNEIIFPFYYAVTKGIAVFDNNLDVAECFCFNMFQMLLSNTTIFDFYTTQDQAIIMHHLNYFETLTKKYVPNVAGAIEDLKIHPLFYCHRWFALLFLQEHELPYLLGIWDSLIAHFRDLMEYAMFVALGHLNTIGNRVDRNDYTETIYVLQNLEVRNQIKPLLAFASSCWEAEHSKK